MSMPPDNPENTNQPPPESQSQPPVKNGAAKDVVEKAIQALQPPKALLVEDGSVEATPAPLRAPKNPPWTLQQFFDGEIDLDVELATRFPGMPVLSTFKARGLGSRNGREVATLSTQDGSAQVIFDADASTKMVQVSFTFGSMLTLRFTLDELTDANRERWLALMQRREGGLSFLWGPARWEKDYLVCITRKYHTNLYAFSPRSFEAAVRLTPDTMKSLLGWLEKFWKTEDDDADDSPPALLTW